MRPTIRIEGTEKIRANLRAMGKALRRDTLVPIMEDNLQPMAADMRGRARRRTGAMADSVTVSTELSPQQETLNQPITEIEVYVGPGPLPEVIQEEFGNFREGPHPFIRPAFDANASRAMRGIQEDGIKAILDAGEG